MNEVVVCFPRSQASVGIPYRLYCPTSSPAEWWCCEHNFQRLKCKFGAQGVSESSTAPVTHWGGGSDKKFICGCCIRVSAGFSIRVRDRFWIGIGLGEG